MSLQVSTREPKERRSFQLTEFGNNHNKLWKVEIFPLGSNRYEMVTYWGRVGETLQSKTKQVTEDQYYSKINEKRRKGYQEITLHVPDVVVSNTDLVISAPIITRPAKVVKLIDYIFSEAGENIKTYLATNVDALSVIQIDKGRKLLSQAQGLYQTVSTTKDSSTKKQLTDVVMQYYNAIPTQLGRNLRDTDIVVEQFVQQFDEQETRLDQLQAALATITRTPSAAPTNDNYDRLGAVIDLLPQTDPDYDKIMHWFRDGSKHGYNINIQGIYKVTIPSERAAYEESPYGHSLVMRLTHGTRNGNVRHILHEKGRGSGLRIPTYHVNGGMFGSGIYFADTPSKSANYCGTSHSRYDDIQLMFIADVAVGKQYQAKDAMSSLKAAPTGYESVWGMARQTGAWGGFLQYNEYIIYPAPAPYVPSAQNTIRYIVEWSGR